MSLHKQVPHVDNGPGTEATVPSPKTKQADTDTGDNKLPSAESQMDEGYLLGADQNQ